MKKENFDYCFEYDNSKRFYTPIIDFLKFCVAIPIFIAYKIKDSTKKENKKIKINDLEKTVSGGAY